LQLLDAETNLILTIPEDIKKSQIQTLNLEKKLILFHPKLGTGGELLKTVSIRISIYFPQTQGNVLLFSDLSMTHGHDTKLLQKFNKSSVRNKSRHFLLFSGYLIDCSHLIWKIMMILYSPRRYLKFQIRQIPNPI
jgi:hypothetical protein